MKVKAWVALGLLCACAFAAVADDAAKKPAMDPAMMKAMMEAGMPGDAQKKLDGMAGTWDAKVTTWMMPGADPMVMTGTSQNDWIMGGRYLRQNFSGSFMGMPFEGVGYTGYDNVRKQYWGTWMDNMSTGIMMSNGTGMSADGKSWTFNGSMADPMTGKDTTVKETITVADANHHMMEMWAPGPDGQMFKSMTIEYTRKK
jgi:hypothetical protein